MEEDLFLKNLLLREVVPATGCTEVGAVALAAGWAARALSSQGDNLEEIEIEVDESTYKNGFGVGVPGTGESGLAFAAAMGALSPRKVEQGLQILENPESTTIDKARTLIADHRVKVIRVSGPRDILSRAKVRYKDDDASALIQGSHDHLVGVEKNRKPYHGAPASEGGIWKEAEQIKDLKYRTFIQSAQKTDTKGFPLLKQALEMNMRFAMEARKKTPSLRIGQVIEKYGDPGEMGEGLSGKVQFITALAVEARMKGPEARTMIIRPFPSLTRNRLSPVAAKPA